MPSIDTLPSPFADLAVPLSPSELRETAYEIFAAACRTTAAKPLTYIPHSPSSSSDHSLSSSSSSSSSAMHQRSLTSTAASKMKKALGIKSSSAKKSSRSEKRKQMTVGELIRVQMSVSEQTDSRLRRGLLRISASQLGRRIESMVLPLELLQQFKASDFSDQQEYEAWQARNLKLLEAGLLVHPLVPLPKSDVASQRLRQLIRGASERPIETGKNSESMQVLRNAVMTLACRSFDGYPSDTCHWADGFPLNLHIYHILLEACFDSTEEGSIIEEIDEVSESIKKTWVVLGIDQKLHNLVFLWIMFYHFVKSGQVDGDLLFAADSQLGEVLKDAKSTKDSNYLKVVSSTLSLIMGWTEQRLLAYHDTFNTDNIEFMEYIVSLGVSAAEILVEDISNEYRRRREEVDVARSRIETYIRSSLRTAFAQRMEKADSSRHSSNENSPTPRLAILAKDIGDLACKEKKLFSPILKKWHPLAAGVAVATLHTCYANELKQFISGVTELTVDSVQVLKAADKLEKDLVLIAVEDSVDSEDGGKSLIREMPPYDADSSISNLVKKWVKTRVDRLKEWIDRNLLQEVWNPRANKENIAPSAVDILRIIDETLDAFFQLPIPAHTVMLLDLMVGLDRSLQYYISKVKSGCGTRNTFVPTLPPLTRCETGSSLWKKKDKSLTQNLQKRKPLVGTINGEASYGLPQLCVRMNTLNHIRTELENLEKKIRTCLRNAESAQSDISNGFNDKFELSLTASHEGIQQLCESTAYRVIFHEVSHVLWDGLYVGETAASRIYPVLKELNLNLEVISTTVDTKVRNRVITALMKASFDGFLLVLLAGGPSRAFTRKDSQVIEEDFRALKDLYLANGDGLPEELVEKASMQVKNILPLFQTDTETLIDRFKQKIVESFGSVAKSRYPLPPTSGHWSPTEANTILRVLCYRNDTAASKFLKKTYGLPKKV